jgi:ATP-dependent DNA ligase
MALPVEPPVKPMLAKAVDGFDVLPLGGEGLVYEPKWDGFRCIVFRDGDDVVLGSRNEKPLTRYFPEVLPAVRAALPKHCVLDGELVVTSADGRGLDFDALQQRIHPAASRIDRLAAETPASFVAFDLLAVDDRDLRAAPFSERRALLEEQLAGIGPPIHLTPLTDDRATAAGWFTRFEGAGLDGVIAKDPTLAYREEKRVMWKLKHRRTADCALAGFRRHKGGEGIGSLLLGLHDTDGELHHVGVASSFSVSFRRQLIDELEPLRAGALEAHPWRDWAEAAAQGPAAGARMPGGQSRWNATKDLSWEPVRLERVVEVAFEQLQSGRFRHSARFVRWRPDKDVDQCTIDTLDVAVPFELAAILDGRGLIG